MATPLKVGLLGAGGITKGHIPAYLNHPDRVQLKAVCDISETRAQEVAKNAGVETVYTDFDKMLREADIDAVDNCTGHPQHAALSITAVEAGKHVIVEKPMAMTLQECRDMIAAADKAGVTLMVAQNLRYSPEAVAVKRFIDEGKLGDLLALRTHLIRRSGGGGAYARYSDGKQGGGILMAEQVHHIDLLRYYAGNVKRVTAVCKSVGPHMMNGAEDLVIASFAFENGALGDLFGSWNARLSTYDRSYMVFGSEGTIHSTPPGMPEHHHFGTMMLGIAEDRERAFEPIDTTGTGLPSADGMVNEILHFEECVRTGKEPSSSGRDNIETMKIIHGIWESSRTGKAVDLADL